MDPSIRQCAILVGGLGTRLASLTQNTPKPVLDVAGKPFLFWLIRELLRFGIDQFVFLTGFHSDVLQRAVETFAAHLPRRAEFLFSAEPQPAGTGGALFHARHLLQPRFLLCNGDSLFDCNLAAALTPPIDRLGHVVLLQVDDASRYGVAQLDDGLITAFRPRPTVGTPGLINAGIYSFHRDVLAEIEPECSLERDVLPRLAAKGALSGRVATGWFIDIGIPDALDYARREIAGRLRRPAVFLDRDGVLNVDHKHVGTRDRFEWINGALDAIRLITDSGRHAFIVTNQSGVARGFYNEEAVDSLLGWIADEARQAGGTIDDVRYCPHHPDAGFAPYRQVCACRKPEPGMLLDLIRAWDIEPHGSFMIGDKQTDMAAAQAAGVPGYLFTGGNLAAFVKAILRHNARP